MAGVCVWKNDTADTVIYSVSRESVLSSTIVVTDVYL